MIRATMPATELVALAGDGSLPVLVWRFERPVTTISSAFVGGGIGPRSWVLNMQVPREYDRLDVDGHVAEVAHELGCVGEGVGLVTAAPVAKHRIASDGGVEVVATVGLAQPTWASGPDDSWSEWKPGTINVVAWSPVALTPGALVNAVATVTEAKTQALLEAGVPGTGTASDAVCVCCPAEGVAEPFGGPRSEWGGRLARAVHAAVAAGAS